MLNSKRSRIPTVHFLEAMNTGRMGISILIQEEKKHDSNPSQRKDSNLHHLLYPQLTSKSLHQLRRENGLKRSRPSWITVGRECMEMGATSRNAANILKIDLCAEKQRRNHHPTVQSENMRTWRYDWRHSSSGEVGVYKITFNTNCTAISSLQLVVDLAYLYASLTEIITIPPPGIDTPHGMVLRILQSLYVLPQEGTGISTSTPHYRKQDSRDLMKTPVCILWKSVLKYVL